MSKWSLPVLISPLIFACFWLMSFIQFQRNEINSFETWLLTRQCNFAADAAIEELRVSSPDLEINLAEETPQVDPDVAVVEYASMLAQNLGLPDTAYNRDLVLRRYVKCLCIATDAGYYLYMLREVANTPNTISEFISLPLTPYVGQLEDASNKARYLGGSPNVAVTLSKDYVYYVQKNASNNLTDVRRLEITTGDTTTPYKMTKAEKIQASEIINTTITDAMMRALYSVYGNTTADTIELPSQFGTINGQQIINDTAVLAIVDTTGYKFGVNAMAFSVGGAQLVQADPILAWTDASGNKWWCTSSKLKRYINEKHCTIESVVGNMDSRTTFKDRYEAAAHGYYENWTIMGYRMNIAVSSNGGM